MKIKIISLSHFWVSCRGVLSTRCRFPAQLHVDIYLRKSCFFFSWHLRHDNTLRLKLEAWVTNRNSSSAPHRLGLTGVYLSCGFPIIFGNFVVPPLIMALCKRVALYNTHPPLPEDTKFRTKCTTYLVKTHKRQITSWIKTSASGHCRFRIIRWLGAFLSLPSG